MQIILKTSSNAYRTLSSFEKANEFCRGILGRCSGLEYVIIDGEYIRSGYIDLEPVSFHKRHKNRIFSGHLATFSRNVLEQIQRNKYPFSQFCEAEKQREQKHFIELLTILPSTETF
jgi:hypothetical protein